MKNSLRQSYGLTTSANVIQLGVHRRRPASIAKSLTFPSRIAKTCNLCRASYEAASKFDRFCPGCKEHSELYHFHEWLPAS